MKETKLIQVLKSFDKHEFKEFGKFVESPYFSSRKFHIRYFKEIKKYYPDFESNSFTKEKLFAKMYPKEHYNAALIASLNSVLLKLAEEFITYQEFAKDEFGKKRALLDGLISKKLYNLFEAEYKSAEDIMRTERDIDETYFHDLFLLKVMKYNYHSGKQDIKNLADNLFKAMESCILDFIINYSHAYYTMLAENVDANTVVESSMLYEFSKHIDIDSFLKYLEQSGNQYYSIIAQYYFLYRAYSDFNDTGYYFKFRALVEKHKNSIGRQELANLYSQMEGYCVNQVNNGKSEFRKEMFEIHKTMMTNGFLMSPVNSIHIMLYRNILTNSLNLKEYEWAEKFINDYNPMLAENVRQSMNCYSMSYLCFEKKEYEKSLEYLQKVKYEMFLSRLDVRELSLKIHYTLGHYEQVFSQIDSYRHFLSNNSMLSESVRQRQLAFIGIVSDMVKYKTDSDEGDLGDISFKLAQNPSISSKNWLIDKFTELN